VERHRRQAKLLLRSVRGGDAAAIERARRVVGDRLSERFVLADAQHVVAVEAGARSWADLLHGQPAERLVVADELVYAPGEPVRVLVRRRGGRYLISDEGRAVALAGRPSRWLEVAKRVVERERALNVNRRGVVFVPSVEGGADRERLVRRVAEASLALHDELLELP